MAMTRLAIARMFTLLAMAILPDGKPKAYLLLMSANDRIKNDLEYLRRVGHPNE